MTAGSRTFVALSLAALGLSACWTPTAADRGTTLPLDEMYQRRAELPAVVQAQLDAERYPAAFYALELEKSRTHTAWRLLVDRARHDPEAAELVAGIGRSSSSSRLVGETVEGTRGVKIGSIDPSYLSTLQSAQAAYDEEFWAYQRRLDLRLDAMKRGVVQYSLAVRNTWLIATAEETVDSVSPGEALLSFFVGARGVWAMLLTANGMTTKRVDGDTPQLRKLAAELLETARDPTSKEAWKPPAKALYKAFIAPFDSALEEARVESLVVVPHGFVANVPFAILLDEQDAPLLKRTAISYVPSATHHRRGRMRKPFSDDPAMMVVGNANYPPPWSQLPLAEDEARTVSYVFDDRRILVREGATESRFYDLYRRYNILHFATHGLLGEGTGLPAASLVLTPDKGNDGYMTAVEIQRLDLSRTYLVVLSACETSVSTTGKADANIASLTNAFLAAGAPTVVGSQWQVADDSTALLMLQFYRNFLEVGSGEALRQAQLNLANDDKHGHPFFWAAFVLYGWNQ